jgi:hypothetical protein
MALNSPSSEHAGNGVAWGPLEVEQKVKQDGRSLIFYTRRETADGKPMTGPERAEA